jgi:hypothetical protein
VGFDVTRFVLPRNRSAKFIYVNERAWEPVHLSEGEAGSWNVTPDTKTHKPIILCIVLIATDVNYALERTFLIEVHI